MRAKKPDTVPAARPPRTPVTDPQPPRALTIQYDEKEQLRWPSPTSQITPPPLRPGTPVFRPTTGLASHRATSRATRNRSSASRVRREDCSRPTVLDQTFRP